jgi:hypothetical protein
MTSHSLSYAKPRLSIFVHKSLSFQLSLISCRHLTKKYRTSYDLMQDAFPNHVWDRQLFYTRGIRQKFMERVVRTIFPTHEIERNTKKAGLVTEFGNPMEIDCFLPQINLGFEYQVIFVSEYSSCI